MYVLCTLVSGQVLRKEKLFQKIEKNNRKIGEIHCDHSNNATNGGSISKLRADKSKIDETLPEVPVPGRGPVCERFSRLVPVRDTVSL